MKSGLGVFLWLLMVSLLVLSVNTTDVQSYTFHNQVFATVGSAYDQFDDPAPGGVCDAFSKIDHINAEREEGNVESIVRIWIDDVEIDNHSYEGDDVSTLGWDPMEWDEDNNEILQAIENIDDGYVRFWFYAPNE